MKPETAEFIAYAIKLLGDAEKMLDTRGDQRPVRPTRKRDRLWRITEA